MKTTGAKDFSTEFSYIWGDGYKYEISISLSPLLVYIHPIIYQCFRKLTEVPPAQHDLSNIFLIFIGPRK